MPQRHVISITSDTTGVGTGYTTDPVNGRILSIQYESAQATTTIDITVTTLDSSQTVLSAANVTSPKQWAPRQPLHKGSDAVQLPFSSTGLGAVGDYFYAANEKLKIAFVQAGDEKTTRFCIITD